MSAEKIINHEQQELTPLMTSEGGEQAIKTRVDINDLIKRVREEKKKENKINIVFFSLFASLIFVVGLILSF